VIDHPAFPKLPQPTHLEEQISADFKNCEIDGAELAFIELVKWLSGANYRMDGYLAITKDDWQSLRKAAGLEKRG
jgi:hypothetical protein